MSYHSACYNCANCHNSLLSQPAYRMDNGVSFERIQFDEDSFDAEFKVEGAV